MEVIIDTLIKKAVTYHDVLHRFRAGRGMGTAIMELKLAQELAIVGQYPLVLVLLDIIKAYNNLDCGQILKTLEGYLVGPKIQGILTEFWARQ